MIKNSIDSQDTTVNNAEFHNQRNDYEDLDLDNDSDDIIISNEDIDKKRKEFNDKKKNMIINKQIEIIKTIKSLHNERTELQLKSLHNRTPEEYDKIYELNVAIANELSKIQIQYQYQKKLFGIAKEYSTLLKKIKSDAKEWFKISGLPETKLEEYFLDNTNKRWYVNHQFWDKWRKEDTEYKEKLNQPEIVYLLNQIDQRCIEFEKTVGITPTQFHNIYNMQISRGMKLTDKARDEAILRNLRLAMSISTKIRKQKAKSLNSLEYTDLYMEAILGLITGVEKFEYQRDFKLSTYATWWVVQKINRHIEETRHIIKNNTQKDVYKAIATVQRTYENRYHKEPTQQYITLKILLNDYIKVKKGIENVLPKDFIAQNYKTVEQDVINYLNNNWDKISGDRIGVFNLIKKELSQEYTKLKSGRKSKNNPEKNNKNNFTEKKVEVVIKKDVLLWEYMLDLYENQYGIESFATNDYFVEQFNNQSKSSKISKIKNVFFYSQPIVSLENEVGDEENNTYRDTIKAEQISIEEEIMSKERQFKMIDIIKKYLKPKEVEVVALAYGLDMHSEQDFHVISKHLGVSVERIRQIINGSLKKLKEVPEMVELLHTLRKYSS